MSLPGKDFRCRLKDELHEKLRVMAKFHDTEISGLGARLLEKAICGEWHEFDSILKRLPRDK